MKKGVKVSFKGTVGISLGPIERYGVEWILVEYSNGTTALVLQKCLEVVGEGR